MRLKSTPVLLTAAALIFIAVVAVATQGSDGGESRSTPEQPAGEENGPALKRAPSGYSNIYVVDVKDRSVRRLTRNEDEEIAQGPSWSKNGKIVFSEPASDEDFARLFVMNADGSGRREIPTKVTHLFQPAWSPDGRTVAAVRLGAGIYSVDPRTGSARRLTRGNSDEAPTWSPDGGRILFHRQVKGTNWDLYEVGSDGGAERRVTHDPLQQTNPSWSREGQKIAFAEQQRNGKWAIYSMRIDGSDRRRLTDRDTSSQEPSWSPDGSRVAFILQRGSAASVAVVPAAGGEAIRLTDRSVVASEPSWSPDGDKIVFAAKELVVGGGHHE